MTDSFELPAVSERLLMPHIASLFAGADEVKLPPPCEPLTVRVFERGVARFTGRLAAWDGLTVPWA